MVDIDDLLMQTSRTFALAIPLLPSPTRSVVALSYLLFRVADTLEDAERWGRDQRVGALGDFAAVLRNPDPGIARRAASTWVAAQPTAHRGCITLLQGFPELLEQMQAWPEALCAAATAHVLRTAEGMAATQARGDAQGAIVLKDLAELRAYCYAVAGIVGELLTAIFLHDAPCLADVRGELLEHQAAFGEALQLVNVLKDETQDAHEKRRFLPAGVSRGDVLGLARDDLDRAFRYIEALRRGRAPASFVAFTSLPAELARSTLVLLERNGPGAKVPRHEVLRMLMKYQAMAAQP